MKKVLIVGLFALLCWIGTVAYGRTQGSDIRLESRVRRLEMELRQVRSRLTQMSLRPSSGSGSTAPPLPPSAPLNDLSLDEQFDNLATLAIELKQQVRALETRVDQLEELSGIAPESQEQRTP